MSADTTRPELSTERTRFRWELIGVTAVLVIVAVSVIFIWASSRQFHPDDGPEAIWPTGSWSLSSPEAQNMDSAKLDQMMALIDEQNFAYDSVLVVRHGHIVFEQYRNGYNEDVKHHIQSATKSFSSALIGIALQEGFLKDVKQKVVDLLPDYTIANLDARKQRMNLEHLLTMSAGMDWHELDYPYTDARNTLGQMWRSRDAVQHVLDQPMAREPGETWAYNSGTSILLGGILEQATGRDVLSFAREYLFDPIGIADVKWVKTTGDHYYTDGGLYLTPRDMARFGYLMLNEGQWEGKQILSPEWVAQSTEAHFQTGSGQGYGYQWWVLDGEVFAAHGHYEQVIYVIPQTDMVVVFTGNIPDDILAPTNGLLYNYILGSCYDLPAEMMPPPYSEYGVYFEYPLGFGVAESPYPGQKELSAAAGMVQFRFDSYPFELIQALWTEAEGEVDLETYLTQYRALAEASGVEYTTGDQQTITMADHTALSQTFKFNQQGIRLKGITVTWHCPESERIFIFSYASNVELSQQEVSKRALEHLDHFACHGKLVEMD